MKKIPFILVALCLATGAAAQSSGASGGATGGASTGSATGGAAPTGTGAATNNAAPAMGGALSPTPGSMDNQIQSQQNQGGGTGGRGSAVQTLPSTQPMNAPSISGSRRDAASRAGNSRCNEILADRNKHSAQDVSACEKTRADHDPALELDRRLQRENSRAVNSICKGC